MNTATDSLAELQAEAKREQELTDKLFDDALDRLDEIERALIEQEEEERRAREKSGWAVGKEDAGEDSSGEAEVATMRGDAPDPDTGAEP
jgi:hypothetical protein